jgi:WD40 repeat protein/TolB-like protein
MLQQPYDDGVRFGVKGELVNRMQSFVTAITAYSLCILCSPHANDAEGPSDPAIPAKQAPAPLTPLPDGSAGEVSKWEGHTQWVHSVVFHPDGRRVLSSGYDGTRLWDVATGKTIWTIEPGGLAVLSPDGKALIVRWKERLALYNPETGEKRRDFESINAGSIFSLAISPDGKLVATGHSDGNARLWNVSEGKVLHTLQRHSGDVSSIAFSPDGKSILTGGTDKTMRVWDPATGGEIRTFHDVQDSVVALAFTPDGHYVASGDYRNDLLIWDFATGRLEHKLSGHKAGIRCLATSPDGHFVVSGSSDKTLRVWDLRTHETVQEYAGPTDHILSAAFSPDGRFIASSSGGDLEAGKFVRGEDFSIRVWRLPRPPANRDRITVAVLEFVDKGPSVELAPLRTALAEMLTGDLSKYRGLNAVERVRVNQFLSETRLGNSGAIDAETAQRAGRVLTADYLLSGSFSGKEKTITLDVALTKVGQTEPIARWKLSRPAAHLFDLEREVVENCLAALGMRDAKPVAPPPPKPGPSPPVALISFRNVAGSAKLAEMEAGFAEILQADLGAIKNIRLVERDELVAVLAEQKLSMSGLVDPKTAAAIRKLTGAERFIYGAFVEIDGRLRIMARLADTESSSVLASETVEGASEDFAAMVEQLALKLAADLAVEAPADADDQVRAATPVRKLEAAIYSAQARREFRADNRVEATANFERALLVEPDNLEIRSWLVRSLYTRNELAKAIETAEESLALQLPATPTNREARRTLYSYLVNSYHFADQQAKRIDAVQRWAKEFPESSWEKSLASIKAHSLRAMNRRQEAIELLEAEVLKTQASGDPDRFGDALAQLFLFYDSELAFYSGGSRDPAISKHSAAGAVAVVNDLLEVSKGRRDQKAVYWGRVLVPRAANVAYVKDGYNTRYLDTEKRIEVLRKCLDVFSWNAEIAARGYWELATNLEDAKQWAPALDAYRTYLTYDDFEPETPPSSWDFKYIQPNDWIDKQIEARYRIARILQHGLEQKQPAIDAYQDAVRRHGAANFRGPDLIAGLTELQAKPDYAENSVLLWGGSSTALRSWQAVLTPKGFTVHTVRRDHVTAADLSPYKVVVLIRCGNLPLNPLDMLGLRSYVATGGNLLVVVSPAYEAADPSLHNGLLALFNASVDHDDLDPATSTNISPHPITKGITTVMARHAVGLNVPAEASLIRSQGRTVLAALNYRQGRLVVSSFGQWFLPDPTIFGGNWEQRLERRSGHWTSELPVSKLPLEELRGEHQTLLNNAIDWLAAPSPREVEVLRRDFADGWLAGRQFEARAIPQDELVRRMDRMIDSANAGVWKEEALWLAGESLLRKQYYPEPYHLRSPDYGETFGHLLSPQPKYFKRLIDQFADSPLRAYAQWRLGDCEMQLVFQRDRFGDSPNPERALSIYEQVDAPAGSVIWAWKHLRLGRMCLVQDDFENGLAHFRDVSERMEPGPEKSIALLNRGYCEEQLKRTEQARQSYEAVMLLPDINWWERAFEQWCPQAGHIGSSKYFASSGLQRLLAK